MPKLPCSLACPCLGTYLKHRWTLGNSKQRVQAGKILQQWAGVWGNCKDVLVRMFAAVSFCYHHLPLRLFFVEFPHSPQTRALFKFPSRIACPTYRKMRYLVRLMWNWCTSYKTANWKTSCGLPSLCTVCEEEALHIQSGCPKVKCKKRPFWTFENKKFSCFIIWSCTFLNIYRPITDEIQSKNLWGYFVKAERNHGWDTTVPWKEKLHEMNNNKSFPVVLFLTKYPQIWNWYYFREISFWVWPNETKLCISRLFFSCWFSYKALY